MWYIKLKTFSNFVIQRAKQIISWILNFEKVGRDKNCSLIRREKQKTTITGKLACSNLPRSYRHYHLGELKDTLTLDYIRFMKSKYRDVTRECLGGIASRMPNLNVSTLHPLGQSQGPPTIALSAYKAFSLGCNGDTVCHINKADWV